MLDNYRFLTKSRLRQKACFDNVFKTRKRLNSPFGALRYVKTDRDFARLGIIISKKNVRLSVKRNQLRRILREQFRFHQHAICGYDIVFVAYKQANDVSNREFHQYLRQLFTTLAKHSQRS